MHPRDVTPAFAEGDILGYASFDGRGGVWETYYVDIYEPDTLAIRQTTHPLPYPFGIAPEGYASLTNKFLRVEPVGVWQRVRVYLNRCVHPDYIFYDDCAHIDSHEGCVHCGVTVRPWQEDGYTVFDLPLYNGFVSFTLHYRGTGG